MIWWVKAQSCLTESPIRPLSPNTCGWTAKDRMCNITNMLSVKKPYHLITNKCRYSDNQMCQATVRGKYDGLKKRLQSRSWHKVTRTTTWRWHASLSRWKKRRSVLSSRKWTRRAAGMRMCKTYSSGCTRTMQGGTLINDLNWIRNKNKRHNTAHSHHILNATTVGHSRGLKVARFMINSIRISTSCRGRN